MRVWRVCQARHAEFDGEGARLAGGRWNHPGTPVVYTSAHLSLAEVEYFVHLEYEDRPEDLVAVLADVPDTLATRVVDLGSLPPNWRDYPAPPKLADLGTRWVERAETAILVVPSALVPVEQNYLLNPAHPQFRLIRVGTPEPFRYDTRMWKARRRRGP